MPRLTKKRNTPRTSAHKLRSVRAVLAGDSAVSVGKRYGDSARAVAYWVTQYRAGGAAGLKVRPRSGRPMKLSPKQQRRIERFIRATLREGERPTGQALSSFASQSFGVSMTVQHCRRIISRLSANES